MRPPRSRRALGAVAVAVLATLAATVGLAAPAAHGDPPGWTAPSVRFEPLDPVTPLDVAGTGAYRGAVEVRPADGGLAVVNEVGLDDYVRGIAEVPPSWPAAALEAQAVAARTYALWQRAMPSNGSFRRAGADICATQACQVYAGLRTEQRSGGERWVAAVQATSGQVLLHDGRLIKAMYASSNGGRSVSGGVPWLPAVDDPDDAAVSPHARWRSVLPLTRLAAAFPGEGELVAVERTGEVVVLRRRHADGSLTEHGVDPAQVRKALNAGPAPAGVPVAVPSTRFQATTVDGDVVLDGAGFGHLLGMSQFGAMGKARRGMGSADILASYYGGIRPTRVEPQRLPATVRVAVALGRADAAVSSAGRFRVVADDGTVLAHVATGEWRVVPAAGGVRVVPPPGGDAVPTLALVAVDPGGPQPGLPLHVRVTLGAPAILRASGGGGAPPVELGPFDAGEHDLALVVPEHLSEDGLVLEAHAGAGRVSALALRGATAVPVDAAAVVVPAAEPEEGRGPPGQVLAAAPAVPAQERGPAAAATLAVGLLVAVSAALLGTVRSRRAASGGSPA